MILTNNGLKPQREPLNVIRVENLSSRPLGYGMVTWLFHFKFWFTLDKKNWHRSITNLNKKPSSEDARLLLRERKSKEARKYFIINQEDCSSVSENIQAAITPSGLFNVSFNKVAYFHYSFGVVHNSPLLLLRHTLIILKL